MPDFSSVCDCFFPLQLSSDLRETLEDHLAYHQHFSRDPASINGVDLIQSVL